MRTQVQNSNDETAMAVVGAPCIGDVLGDYRLQDLLGEGGMAQVFRAEHVETGAQVAVKVLSPDRSMSLAASRNFALEADAARRIAHPNTITIHENVDSHPCYRFHVMDLLEGTTLRDVMDAEAEMDVTRTVTIARQLADALAATHTAGFVHRDVKPENVMIGRDGGVTLIDFGAVKDVNDKIVAGETIVGTPLYMAPEQMWGHGTTALSDVYAFGLLLYEMLAGKLPFKSRKFVELREERSTQDPTPLRTTLREQLKAARSTRPQRLTRHEVPAQLEALVMACLARDPAARPASMREVAAKLAQIIKPVVRHLRVAPTSALMDSSGSKARANRTPSAVCSTGRCRTALGYAAAAVALFISSSTLVSDVHTRGPRDRALVVVAAR